MKNLIKLRFLQPHFRMKAKNLANWAETFKVTETPWLYSDWDAVLIILWKMLRIDNRYIFRN